MASLIDCPHCGPRPKEEFTIRGDASLRRPAPDADADAWNDYVFLRENPRGRYREYWHHGGGCRRWLVVARDTLSHAVEAVADAAASADAGAARAGQANAGAASNGTASNGTASNGTANTGKTAS